MKALVKQGGGGAVWMYDDDVDGRICWDCGEEIRFCEGIDYPGSTDRLDPPYNECDNGYPILGHIECRVEGNVEQCCQPDLDWEADAADRWYDIRQEDKALGGQL